MSSSVSKAGSLGYALRDEFWKDVWELGLDVVIAGKRGFELFRAASGDGTPDVGNKELIRRLDDFLRDQMPPQTKVRLFHHCQTFDKSISLVLDLQSPEERVRLMNAITGIVAKAHEATCEGQYIKRGAQGVHRVPSCGHMIFVPDTEGSRGQSHFHVHGLRGNFSFFSPTEWGAIGNGKAVVYDPLDVTNARIQKEVADLVRSKGIETELSPDGKHARVVGISREAIEALSPGSEEIRNRLEAAGRAGDPRAAAWAALAAHAHAKRNPEGRIVNTLEEKQLFIRLVLEEKGIDPQRFIIPEFGRPRGNAEASSAARDQQFTAYDVVNQALNKVVQDRGFFSATQLREEAYLAGIGKDVSREKIAEVAKMVLTSGAVQRVILGDHVRYMTPESPEVLKKSAKKHVVDVAEKWWEAAREAVSATTEKAKVIVAKLAEKYSEKLAGPQPPTITIDASRIQSFIREHSRKPYLKAHRDAIVDGLTQPTKKLFDIQERLLNAERSYAESRRSKRLEKGTEIIVRDGYLVDAKDEAALKKLARRDGVKVTLTERESGPAPQSAKKQEPEGPARYEFRGEGRQKIHDTPER